MGLGVSHECWSGSYSSFTEWRRELALAAGFPPLDMMDGYYCERDPSKEPTPAECEHCRIASSIVGWPCPFCHRPNREPAKSHLIDSLERDESSFLRDAEWYVQLGQERIPASVSKSLSPAMRRAISALPIRWDYFKSDPLTILLMHSDTDGLIEYAQCKPLAERLRQLLPKLPRSESPYGNLTLAGKTEKFAAGLMRAHERGENVEFH